MKKFLTGNVFAQIIPLLMMPVLARLYSVEVFGEFALNLAVISIASMFSTYRLEYSFFSENEKSVDRVINYCLLILQFNTVMLFVVLSLFFELIDVFFLVSSIVVFSFNNLMCVYLNRKDCLDEIVKIRIATVSIVSIIQLSLSIFQINISGAGIFIGWLLGYLLSSLYLLGKFRKSFCVIRVNKRVLTIVIARAKKTLALSFSHGMNSFVIQIPSFVISHFYGNEALGFYSMAYKLIRVPTIFVGNSFGELFRSEASKEFLEHKNFERTYKKYLKILSVLSVSGFSFIYLLHEHLVILVLGKEWFGSVVYVLSLYPLFIISFVSSPLSSSYIVVKKYSLDLKVQCVFFAGSLLSASLAFTIEVASQWVLIYSIVMACIYLGNVWCTYSLSRNNDEKFA
ncbi:oligosaccharide flippase family protein [Shewanella rhizosphaerae]|uniref:lipopolysaccharide biosynthesis protein n=1 Tax=Shewanella rhizosphaerae TaxID=2864207 RepID=UPI001C65F1CF|nr:oligosaccharide flippase family protein [Shewanella rhizosphaerae]QYK14254.1 oligosaccharide flippase family protein [Shewanella rhizosphaerae]